MKKSKIMKKISLAMLIFMFIASGFVYSIPPAGAALVPGGAVGPVVPAGLGKGFPAWYMDQNGLALEVMEAADGFGISDPVDPANNFSQELGFNAEGFYWVTEGGPVNPHGISLMVLAMEMAFAGEEAVNGEQSVFGRIRLRFDVGEPGTYTIRHPFGTNTYDVAAVGPGPEINDSSDIGCFATLNVLSCDPNTPPNNPNNFGLALQSGIGPFLTWDTFNLDPALSDPLLVNPAFPGKRYIGNPGVAHAIKGSPVGQNSIRVEGPNIGGPGVDFIEETQFSVAGRIAVIDTVPPVINVTPKTAAIGSTNVVLSANITDDIGVRSATIDLGSLGNTLSALINNANEVPPTGSTRTGTGAFTIDTAANTLTFNINAAIVPTNPVTHVHIHQGAAGVNGPMLFDAGSVLPAVGVWSYPEADEANILAGNTYVQIHTALFDNPANLAGGEIRGQILPQSNIVSMSLVTLPNTNGIWSALVPSLDRLGTFSLPLTATDGSQITNGTLVLNVVPLLNAVNVTPSASTIIVGNTQQLSVTALDPASAPIVPTPPTTWASSNNLVATVDNNGLVTAVGVGSATITATVNDGVTTLSNTATVTVNPIPVLTSVVVTPLTASLVIGAGNFQLTASGLDQLGNPMALPAGTSWSSNNQAVATVDANGLVTPLTAGTVIIRATNGILFGEASLLVTTAPQVFTSMSLTPATATLTGGSQQLTASALDQFGNAMATQPDITFTSSNTGVATVNASGLVTVLSAGNTTITAASGAINATSVITVSDVLTTIDVTPATIIVGGTRQATASALNQFGAPMAATLTWSSNNALVAAINSTSGLISAITAGTATITATSGLVSGTAAVNVVLGPTLTTINVTPAAPTIVIGGSQQLTATTLDQDGAPIAAILTWSSSNPAATVDANGLVTGVSSGTAVITAANGTVQGSVTVTIQTPVLTTINLTPASPSVTAGNTLQLSAAGLDQLGGAMTLTGTTTWSSSNTGVGTVSQTGLFTALAAGSTVVSAANSTATGTVSVTVNAVPAPASSGSGAVIGGGGGGFFLPPAQFQTTATPPNPEVQRQIERQLEVEREFRIRQQGGGQVLGERIEFRQVQIQQIANEADMISAKNLIALLANAAASRQQAKEKEIKIKFVAKLKTNLNGSLSQDDESAIANFITYGTANTKKLGEGERAGVLDSYKAAFGKLPTSKSQWEDALKIAVGRFPGEINTVAEARAKIEFKKIYLRDASMNNEKDKAAVSVMAYGLRPDRRNTNSEKAAITTFRAVFKKSPGTATDWDKVRAIAYSGAKR